MHLPFISVLACHATWKDRSNPSSTVLSSILVLSLMTPWSEGQPVCIYLDYWLCLFSSATFRGDKSIYYIFWSWFVSCHLEGRASEDHFLADLFLVSPEIRGAAQVPSIFFSGDWHVSHATWSGAAKIICLGSWTRLVFHETQSGGSLNPSSCLLALLVSNATGVGATAQFLVFYLLDLVCLS